jgi:acyl-CoA synthetase (AMP-forming)/AMP-acid ligase II
MKQCMPLYHSTAALLGYLACLMRGTTIIIGRRFSARNFWKEVRDNDATMVQYVGETLRYLLATPPEIDPVTGEDLDKKNNVRMFYGNGLRPDVWNRVKDRFDVETVSEFYASTEGSSGAWNRSSNNFSAGAVGRNGTLAGLVLGPTVGVVELDHETETPRRDPRTGLCKRVPRGEPGELLYALDPDDVKRAFQGYFNNSRATEKKILRDVFKKGDAWFRTGDVMRWDDEGRWYFSDRIGDTFRWKSENVSTSEVAGVLGSHPEIHEANVYGVLVPHHEGRAGCAAIVFKQQAGLPNAASAEVLAPSASTIQSVADHAFANLPRYSVPVFLRVTREMQATGNNKQQKHALRTEGVDPELLESKNCDDKLYWLNNGTYVPFGKKQWAELNSCKVKL